MIVAVADTHTFLWYLAADARLSPTARTFMERANDENNEIAVSSITLIEIVYLTEKGKIQIGRFTDLIDLLEDHYSMFTQVAIDSTIVLDLMKVKAADIPDMPDRIIAATALRLDVPVISRDSKIRQSDIRTIW